MKLTAIAVTATAAALSLAAYHLGPASELTGISRLHYNALFELTPCTGKAAIFEDENLRFKYSIPPRLFSTSAAMPADPLHSGVGNELANVSELTELPLPLQPSYSFKQKAQAIDGSLYASRITQVKNQQAEYSIVNIDLANGYGPEHLLLTGKSGVMYRLELPFFPERMKDRNWLFAALYHLGIFSRETYPDMLPPSGFWKWFLTPCSDKQYACYSRSILESLETKK